MLCTCLLASFQLLGPCQLLLSLTFGLTAVGSRVSQYNPGELLHAIHQAGRRKRLHHPLRHLCEGGGNAAEPFASATLGASAEWGHEIEVSSQGERCLQP